MLESALQYVEVVQQSGLLLRQTPVGTDRCEYLIGMRTAMRQEADQPIARGGLEDLDTGIDYGRVAASAFLGLPGPGTELRLELAGHAVSSAIACAASSICRRYERWPRARMARRRA